MIKECNGCQSPLGDEENYRDVYITPWDEKPDETRYYCSDDCYYMDDESFHTCCECGLSFQQYDWRVNLRHPSWGGCECEKCYEERMLKDGLSKEEFLYDREEEQLPGIDGMLHAELTGTGWDVLKTINIDFHKCSNNTWVGWDLLTKELRALWGKKIFLQFDNTDNIKIFEKQNKG